MDNDERALRLAVMHIALEEIIKRHGVAEQAHRDAEERLHNILQQKGSPVEQRTQALDFFVQQLLKLSGANDVLGAANRMVAELKEAETE